METVNCARSEAVKKRAAAAKDIKEEPRAAACMPRSSFGGDGETKKLKVGIEPAEELKETRARNISFFGTHAHPQTQTHSCIHPQDMCIVPGEQEEYHQDHRVSAGRGLAACMVEAAALPPGQA